MSVRTEKDGPIWTVIMDRPQARNAVNPETAQALAEAFRAFDADPNSKVGVFFGDHGNFCSIWYTGHEIVQWTAAAPQVPRLSAQG